MDRDAAKVALRYTLMLLLLYVIVAVFVCLVVIAITASLSPRTIAELMVPVVLESFVFLIPSFVLTYYGEVLRDRIRTRLVLRLARHLYAIILLIVLMHVYTFVFADVAVNIAYSFVINDIKVNINLDKMALLIAIIPMLSLVDTVLEYLDAEKRQG